MRKKAMRSQAFRATCRYDGPSVEGTTWQLPVGRRFGNNEKEVRAALAYVHVIPWLPSQGLN